MKKRSHVFLIILSLILLLVTSCGIPNYFGNIGSYTKFYNQYFSIDDKVLPDGFSTHDIQPKIMFLYTIYSDYSVTDSSYYSIQSKLESQFRDDFKLADYDYKGCPNVGDKAVSTVVIKDTDNTEIEYKPGLYQLKVKNSVKQPPSYNYTPTNFSSDYLFNKDNLEFKYNENYHFTYELKAVGESDDVTLVISCLDSKNNTVASYEMVNYRNDDFHTSYAAKDSPDYEYGKESNTYLCILPVMYLESNVYSNRQMKTGTWYSMKLEAPKRDTIENNSQSSN